MVRRVQAGEERAVEPASALGDEVVERVGDVLRAARRTSALSFCCAPVDQEGRGRRTVSADALRW